MFRGGFLRLFYHGGRLMALELLDPAREPSSQYERLRAIAQSWRGETARGIPLRQTGVSDDNYYAGDFANAGSGTFALRASAGGHYLTVNGAGVTLSSATVAGAFVVGGNLTVNGNTTLGDASSDSTTIQGGLTQSGGAVSLSSPTTLALTATGAATLSATSWSVTGPVTLVSALTARANVTVRNGATGATLALFDAGNSRLTVGSATALTSASNDLFAAIGGRAYVAPAGEDQALGLRYNATSGTVYLGASNSATSPSLIVKGHNGVQVAAFNDSTSTVAQLAVTGIVTASSKLVVGATAFSGSEVLRVVGTTRLENTVSVIGATIDLENNRSYRAGDGSTQRNLAKYDSGGVAQFAENGATGAVVDAGYVQLKYNGTVRFEVNTTGIGMFGVSPIARPTVVGVRTGTLGQLQTAFASLCSALNSLGAIIDATT